MTMRHEIAKQPVYTSLNLSIIPSLYLNPIEKNQRKETLPAQYTVRSWRKTSDCLSAIANMPFIYGNYSKWRILYEANKSKLPRPDNPNIIYPGTVLDIPSLEGEEHSGMWSYDEQ